MTNKLTNPSPSGTTPLSRPAAASMLAISHSYVRTPVLLAAHIILCLAGCHSVPHGSQHFTVEVRPLGGQSVPRPLVILEEVYRIKETAESSGGYSQTLLRARMWCPPDNTFIADSPPMTDRFVWAFNNRVEYRWTVFSPGFVATTFYPEGFILSWWDPDTGLTRMRKVEVGWRPDRLRPIQLPGLGLPPGFRAEYPTGDTNVSLVLPLRSLGTPSAAPYNRFATTVPVELTSADAWNFDDQIRTLVAAVEKVGPQKIDPNCRRLALAAIEQQDQAIAQARFYPYGPIPFELMPSEEAKLRTKSPTPEQRITRLRNLLLSNEK